MPRRSWAAANNTLAGHLIDAYFLGSSSLICNVHAAMYRTKEASSLIQRVGAIMLEVDLARRGILALVLLCDGSVVHSLLASVGVPM